jgi:membrane protease YdiL (CAAX protease family)
VDGSARAWLRRHSLLAYTVLAYALSWAVEIPIALSLRGTISTPVPLWIHYLASLGPGLAALIVSLLTEGSRGAARLLGGLGRWRVGWRYALFAIVAPAALFAVAMLATCLMQGTWPDLSLLGQVDYLPYLGIPRAVVLWLLTFGLAEEIGWRGFALPRLQATRSAFSASVVLGVLWALWHVPAFLYRDTYIAMGLLVVPLMLFSVSVGSVVHTWLYNSTRGSLLMVVLFHGLFDFFSVSAAGGETAPVIMTAVLVFWAVRVVKVYGSANLSPVEKVVYDGRADETW